MPESRLFMSSLSRRQLARRRSGRSRPQAGLVLLVLVALVVAIAVALAFARGAI
ncbi:MAG: hypothetical protein ACRDL5_04400 [Solirubrobacteraceae bacterium]